jgi:hypothetical protein
MVENILAVTELGVVFSSDDENKEDEDEAVVVDGQLMSSVPLGYSRHYLF